MSVSATTSSLVPAAAGAGTALAVPAASRPLPAPALMPTLRGPTLMGWVAVLLFFGGLGGWSALAPLASAAVTHGTVSPDGNRRTVQHLEGGIVRELRVREGSRVQQGDALLVLEDVQARAVYEANLGRAQVYAASKARLLAEQAEAPRIDFPPELLAAAEASPRVAEAVGQQRALFETRRLTHQGREAVLRQKVAQLDEEIRGHEATISSLTAQLELLDLEIAGVQELYTKGLERRPRLLALQRVKVQAEGDRAEKHAEIARAKREIGEAELEILSLRATRLDDINKELTTVQTELSALEESLRSSRDVLKRIVVTAPVTGTVVELQHHTPGGVVKPGERILDLVPDGEELLIDARVAPVDIEEVHPGLAAQIHLLPYRQRHQPRLEGVVRTVAADSRRDEVTGEVYYLARVEVDADALRAADPPIELVPGMPAEVLIMTGRWTMLDYLLQPVVESFRRSFRES